MVVMVYLFVYLLFTLFILLIPGRKVSFTIAGGIIFLFAFLSSWLSLQVFLGDPAVNTGVYQFLHDHISGLIICDKLSAFFILVINFTVVTGWIYSSGYLKPYLGIKPEPWIKLHYLALVWLQLSMTFVPLFRNGFYFLIVWEIMTLSSFILVVFNYDEKGTLNAGINYLIQMHIGMVFILAGFLVSSRYFASVSFENLGYYFLNNHNWPVFLLFFIGFGLKAGFFTLHTWLPDAHPAAPSHVSGIMSGVMIKLGIYGILRVTTYLANDLEIIGISLILISAITGLFGVMMAILQHDIKKLLAYHSIENIGIIGLGIGLGIYGSATGSTVVSAAGYAGALLHTLNHSLFKSLLFYSSGSVSQKTHTRNVEKMGGLMKYMPYTSWAFLIGAVAIVGLPPFNGFISEFLIYTSMFNGIANSAFYPLILFFIAMLSLVLIGGLALLCFTKVFGIVFLGQPREKYPETPSDPDRTMIVAKILPVLAVILIGLLPFIFIPPLMVCVGTIFKLDTASASLLLKSPLNYISVASTGMILLSLLIIIIRKAVLARRIVATESTWGCGYEAVNEKQQYTATSFIQEYAGLTNPIIKTGHTHLSYSSKEIFPGQREFHTHSDDAIRSKIINRPARFLTDLLRKAAVFQTGKLQHYVLYVLLFLLLIFLLTLLKII
jgi:hydrogenase-4 component B